MGVPWMAAVLVEMRSSCANCSDSSETTILSDTLRFALLELGNCNG